VHPLNENPKEQAERLAKEASLSSNGKTNLQNIRDFCEIQLLLTESSGAVAPQSTLYTKTLGGSKGANCAVQT